MELMWFGAAVVFVIGVLSGAHWVLRDKPGEVSPQVRAEMAEMIAQHAEYKR